jgi:hypothetical protein
LRDAELPDPSAAAVLGGLRSDRVDLGTTVLLLVAGAAAADGAVPISPVGGETLA